MIMKRWRVGSLTMGLVLLASGLLMMISLAVKVNILNVLLTFWPVILICLGIEVLLHLFVKNSGEKLRYDILSVMFIGFLLVVSIGFYGVTYYIGLFESREDMNAALGIMSENAYAENSATLAGTKELVVFDGFSNITVLPARDSIPKIDYSVSVSTYDKNYANDILDSAVKLEQGERAFLRSDTALFRNNSKVGWPSIGCVIYLPPETSLDLSQFHGLLEYDRAIEEQIIREY